MNEPTPTTPSGRGSLGSKVFGAATGGLVVLSAFTGFSLLAGAQSDSNVDAGESASAPAAETEVVVGEDEFSPFTIDEDFDFTAFDACMTEQLGEGWLPAEKLGLTGVNGLEDLDDYANAEGLKELEAAEEAAGDADIDDVDLEAMELAAKECSELLPGMLAGTFDDMVEFEGCLADQGVDVMGHDDWDEPAVFIEGEEFQGMNFGPDGGQVVITSDGEALSVEVTGDVEVLTEADFEKFEEAEMAAFEACEQYLPEAPFAWAAKADWDHDDWDHDDWDHDDWDHDDEESDTES